MFDYYSFARLYCYKKVAEIVGSPHDENKSSKLIIFQWSQHAEETENPEKVFIIHELKCKSWLES